ncbi:MAG: transporter [Pseudomonadota bacterium]
MRRQQAAGGAGAGGAAGPSRALGLPPAPVPAPAPAPALASALAPALALALALGGCASPTGIAPQARPLTPAQAGIDAGAPPAPALAAAWWHRLGDPALDALVAQALAEQPTLKAAAARLARARAVLATAEAAREPQAGVTLDATRQRFSANSIYPPPLGGSLRTLASLQLDASWEIDFFGRQGEAIAAAAGSARAAEADFAAARRALAAGVVRAWAQLGRLHEQHDLVRRALAQREQMAALVAERARAGLDTRLELHRSEAALPELRQQIEQIDEQIGLVRHALAALVARPAAALPQLQPSAGAANAFALPDALPADLLGRRADIAAARWRVEAAGGELRAARAQFYPNVNLLAFAGAASLGLERLLRAGSEQYGVGPALSLPLFDAGRLRANLRARAADLDAAVESYNAAVLEAVRDTADQLGSLAAIARQQHEQAATAAAIDAAYALAAQRYRAGLGNRLVLLEAESAVLAQQRSASELRWRRLDTQIALVKALGGGYVAADVPADRAPARP